MNRELPAYSNPCLAHSVDSHTLYLVGVNDAVFGRIELNSIDLLTSTFPNPSPFPPNPPSPPSPALPDPLDNPEVRLLTFVVDPQRWRNTAPKFCSNYAGSLGRGPLNINPRIHIQQFSRPWSYDTNAGGKVGIDLPTLMAGGVGYVSPKLFAIVGQAGNTTLDMGLFPSEKTLLAVGTFSATSEAPAHGYLITFDPDGRQGWIYPSLSYDPKANTNYIVQLEQPRSVVMNDIRLSVFAVPVHMGHSAYILDQARDGTVMIYTINPEVSPALTQIYTSTNKAPGFSEFLVASGSESQSRIVMYSVIRGSPRLNSFDTISKTWTGPGLLTSTNGTLGGSFPAPGDNSNGTNGSSGGKLNGAVVGGAVAGGLILVILAIALLVVLQRRRSQSGRKTKVFAQSGSGSAVGDAAESRPVLSDYQDPSRQFDSSGSGSYATSAVPLNYMSHSQPTTTPPPLITQRTPSYPLPQSTPVPQYQQQYQPQYPPQQQQQQPAEVSFPSVQDRHQQQQLQHLHLAQPYSPGPAFSSPTIYQAQPVRQNTATSLNNGSGSSRLREYTSPSNQNDDDEDDEQPYTLPATSAAPSIGPNIARPHKTEIP
ncbi:hypothetical protein BGX29_011993 [Mortierella sp. GBA35]|nr:hypothetical protein BGX29_011993 [Mortierella sp. GBA35]